ncbi:Putative acid shock protein [Escherichia coli CFT073]|uniref:Putative acid shock protein n=2 Tax=Escherichia coli TaxID=562 RepID=A0A0H2V7J6_ECOL6|nr:Putative acid shock protein [Escherichia coli CFT073]ABE07263.1 putative acid shock protein [Escherichia coli UTI89]
MLPLLWVCLLLPLLQRLRPHLLRLRRPPKQRLRKPHIIKNSIKQHLPRKRRRLKSIIKMPKLNRKLLNKKRRQRRNTPRNTAISNRQNLLHNPQRKFSTVMLARPLAPENYGAKRVTFSTAFSGG